jgi:eukaryotic-like serine/threonine-protein kinase
MMAGLDRLVGGRYHLEALVGKGGMGEVWRARHTALQTQVAVKFLHAGSAASERAQRRFLTEAQVTANLRTRHAVQVFDFGVTGDGRPYLVMELLEGETLDRRIAREGRLPVVATAAILEQAARALDRAHTLGIVHRDFKPENVMLVADEEAGGELVKVVDFGIAKLVGDLDDTLKGALGALAMAGRPVTMGGPRAPQTPQGPEAREITSVGVGTPYYMAPEQAQDSAQVGPAADIWAFGVVAYECLTGRRPFDGDSIGELLLRVLAAEPPPPASTYAPVPGAFDAWFRVACARDPAARFPDLRAASAALERALAEPVSPIRLESAGAEPPPAVAPAGTSPLAATLDPRPCPPAPPPEAFPPAPPRTRRLARRIPVLAGMVLVALVAAGVTVRRGHTVALERVSVAAPPPAVSPAPVVVPPAPVEPSAAPPTPPPPEPPAPATSARPPSRRAPSRPRAYTLPPLGL